jgi:DNA polymerase-4
MPRRPRICCLDLDTFFVSVERLLDPSLVGKRVIVGAGMRGVVLAASYEVRAFGVHSGMSMADARKRAPNATYVPPRHKTYTPYAAQVRDILGRFTPAVQTASIDEFFLDFHGCERLYRRSPERHAPQDDARLVDVVHGIRQTILEEVGLPCSAGIGCTRTVAKIASGLAKPHRRPERPDARSTGTGVVLVPAGFEHAWLGGLPVRRFPGIGPSAEKRLLAMGLRTLDHVVAADDRRRERIQGTYDRVLEAFEGETPSLGRDRPAFREHDPDGCDLGSISNERTFSADLSDRDEVDRRLRSLVERVCWRARKRGVVGRTVTLKLRYRDFVTLQRSRTGPATAEDAHVLATVRELLDAAWSKPVPLRLLGVGLSNLTQPGAQLDLSFDGRGPSASPAIDHIRERFGYDAITLGRTPTGTSSRWTA